MDAQGKLRIGLAREADGHGEGPEHEHPADPAGRGPAHEQCA